MNMEIKTASNGELTLISERSKITFHPDGTIAVSSLDPVQLTGDTAAALVKEFGETRVNVFEFLKSLNKKK